MAIAMDYLDKAVGEFSPRPEYKETYVVMNLEDSIIDSYLDSMMATLHANTRLQLPDDFEDKLREYLVALLTLRVLYVNGQKLPPFIKEGRITVPAFISVLLENIGYCESKDYGLVLVPKLKAEPNKDGIVGWDEYHKAEVAAGSYIYDNQVAILEFSRLLRYVLDSCHVEYATGFPRSRDGNLQLMSMQVIKNEVWNESNHSAPVFGLMAAALGLSQVTQVVYPRISYGSFNFLKRLLYQVVDYETKIRS